MLFSGSISEVIESKSKPVSGARPTLPKALSRDQPVTGIIRLNTSARPLGRAPTKPNAQIMAPGIASAAIKLTDRLSVYFAGADLVHTAGLLRVENSVFHCFEENSCGSSAGGAGFPLEITTPTGEKTRLFPSVVRFSTSGFSDGLKDIDELLAEIRAGKAPGRADLMVRFVDKPGAFYSHHQDHAIQLLIDVDSLEPADN